MIEGGWAYIYAAYAATLALLGGLALAIFLHARRWASEARKLDERQ